jgi:hypothetical protein
VKLGDDLPRVLGHGRCVVDDPVASEWSRCAVIRGPVKEANIPDGDRVAMSAHIADEEYRAAAPPLVGALGMVEEVSTGEMIWR